NPRHRDEEEGRVAAAPADGPVVQAQVGLLQDGALAVYELGEIEEAVSSPRRQRRTNDESRGRRPVVAQPFSMPFHDPGDSWIPHDDPSHERQGMLHRGKRDVDEAPGDEEERDEGGEEQVSVSVYPERQRGIWKANALPCHAD